MQRIISEQAVAVIKRIVRKGLWYLTLATVVVASTHLFFRRFESYLEIVLALSLIVSAITVVYGALELIKFALSRTPLSSFQKSVVYLLVLIALLSVIVVILLRSTGVWR